MLTNEHPDWEVNTEGKFVIKNRENVKQELSEKIKACDQKKERESLKKVVKEWYETEDRHQKILKDSLRRLTEPELTREQIDLIGSENYTKIIKGFKMAIVASENVLKSLNEQLNERNIVDLPIDKLREGFEAVCNTINENGEKYVEAAKMFAEVQAGFNSKEDSKREAFLTERLNPENKQENQFMSRWITVVQRYPRHKLLAQEGAKEIARLSSLDHVINNKESSTNKILTDLTNLPPENAKGIKDDAKLLTVFSGFIFTFEPIFSEIQKKTNESVNKIDKTLTQMNTIQGEISKSVEVKQRSEVKKYVAEVEPGIKIIGINKTITMEQCVKEMEKKINQATRGLPLFGKKIIIEDGGYFLVNELNQKIMKISLEKRRAPNPTDEQKMKFLIVNDEKSDNSRTDINRDVVILQNILKTLQDTAFRGPQRTIPLEQIKKIKYKVLHKRGKEKSEVLQKVCDGLYNQVAPQVDPIPLTHGSPIAASNPAQPKSALKSTKTSEGGPKKNVRFYPDNKENDGSINTKERQQTIANSTSASLTNTPSTPQGQETSVTTLTSAMNTINQNTIRLRSAGGSVSPAPAEHKGSIPPIKVGEEPKERYDEMRTWLKSERNEGEEKIFDRIESYMDSYDSSNDIAKLNAAICLREAYQKMKEYREHKARVIEEKEKYLAGCRQYDYKGFQDKQWESTTKKVEETAKELEKKFDKMIVKDWTDGKDLLLDLRGEIDDAAKGLDKLRSSIASGHDDHTFTFGKKLLATRKKQNITGSTQTLEGYLELSSKSIEQCKKFASDAPKLYDGVGFKKSESGKVEIIVPPVSAGSPPAANIIRSYNPEKKLAEITLGSTNDKAILIALDTSVGFSPLTIQIPTESRTGKPADGAHIDKSDMDFVLKTYVASRIRGVEVKLNPEYRKILEQKFPEECKVLAEIEGKEFKAKDIKGKTLDELVREISGEIQPDKQHGANLHPPHHAD